MILNTDIVFIWLYYVAYLILYNITLLGVFLAISYLTAMLASNFFILNVTKNLLLLNSFLFVSLSSLGGVPPFAGFFFKVFVLTKMIGLGFFFLCAALIPILLVTLYFYFQNARYLLSHERSLSDLLTFKGDLQPLFFIALIYFLLLWFIFYCFDFFLIIFYLFVV